METCSGQGDFIVEGKDKMSHYTRSKRREAAKELKDLGVEVVVFPPDLTSVIRPLDKAMFRFLKNSFRQFENKSKVKNNHIAPTLANFVSFLTTTHVKSVTAKNIWSVF